MTGLRFFALAGLMVGSLYGGSLDGRVTNSVTGAGIQGVSVSARRVGVSGDAVTDEAGRFRMANLPDGNYRVTYEKDGYGAPGSDHLPPPVSVSGDTLTQGTLTPFASLRGRVTDAEGKPVAGIAVRLSAPMAEAVTDAEGNFEFDRLRPGSYTLSATPKESGVTTYFRSTVDEEQAERIEVAGVDLFGYESGSRRRRYTRFAAW